MRRNGVLRCNLAPAHREAQRSRKVKRRYLGRLKWSAEDFQPPVPSSDPADPFRETVTLGVPHRRDP